LEWLKQVNDSPVDWLMQSDAAGVSYLTLRNVLGRLLDDPELDEARAAAHTDGPIAGVLAAMEPEGYWVKPGPGYGPKYRSTVWAIILLAQLGASVECDERIQRACGYLLDHALADGGQFSYNREARGTFDCLQGNLCAALMELGCDDPRLAGAFEWMARTVTGEAMAPLKDHHAPLRYYRYKCGPNFACGANDGLPCAWGAAKVMLALSRWPEERRTPLIRAAIEQGVQFLLSTDPAKAMYRERTGGQPHKGWFDLSFPVFYLTDVLQLVEALTGLGYGQDPRLANALEFVLSKQDAQGRWPLERRLTQSTWGSFGRLGQPNPWVTVRALTALRLADAPSCQSRRLCGSPDRLTCACQPRTVGQSAERSATHGMVGSGSRRARCLAAAIRHTRRTLPDAPQRPGPPHR